MMHLLSVLLLVLRFLFSETKNDIEIKARSLGRHKELGLSYANFKAHKNSYLKVNKVEVVQVHELKECGIACAKHCSCFSFNIAIHSDNYGHFLCELLAADKYNKPAKFSSSGDFHHFSIMTSCFSKPCENRATCIPRYEDDTYTCVCPVGFTGRHCETDIDDCDPVPCKNGATCVDLVNDYSCTCAAGWNGKNCHININDCAPAGLCKNGGTCVDLVNDYRCTCAAGWNGKNCEININECAPGPCKNHGTCVDLVKDYHCTCAAGWKGKNCDININECAPGPCKNRGTCVDLVNDYRCTCASGWKGKNCDININECASGPCKNRGTCVDLVNNYRCTCAAGWKGKNCDININECTPGPCKNHGTCVDLVNDYRCTCAAGWKGKNCDINVNECAPGPCKNRGTCVDLINDYRCTCAVGWKGKNCDINIDDCARGPCKNGATCVDLINDYRCTCAAGWNGRNCDISTSCAVRNTRHMFFRWTRFMVYCDMTNNGGGWTLIARFSNRDGKNWMRDDGYWWYDQRFSQGQTTNPSNNYDMISPAFWSVRGRELKITRSDDSSHTALLRTTGNCLAGRTFRSMISSFGRFTGCTSWARDRCRGSCSVVYGGLYQSTSGFSQARCSSNIQSYNYIGFWCDWSSGDGAVMMIGGGGIGCQRADHGIGITETNNSTFQYCGSDNGELDFGNEANSGSTTSYSLNLWVR